MLKVSGLSKQYGEQMVVAPFNLKVPEHSFVVLIGPSGCGKSTLFDVLTGVVTSDSGTLSWRDKPLSHLGDTAAYMQQKDLLLPWFSLLDNALLPVKINGGNLDASRDQAIHFFKRLGLHGFEAYMPHEVSGGMRQRCALVRTLMFNRDLILLDEPLSSLDAITRRSLQDLLLMLQLDFNKTLLMITHDIEEALLTADELYLLSAAPMGVKERFVLEQKKPRQFNDPILLNLKRYLLEKLQEELNYVAP